MRPYLRYAIAGTLAILMGAAQLALFGVDVTPAVAQPASAAASVADSGGTLIAWGAIAADLLVLMTLAGFVASERRVGYQASRFVRPVVSRHVEAAKPVVVGSEFDAVDELLTADATETLVPTSLVTSLTERRVEERRLRERQQAEEAQVGSTAA